MKSVFRTLLAGAALLPLATAATAQDLPATDFNVVGSWSNLPLYQEFERKFWEETVPAESGGATSYFALPATSTTSGGAPRLRNDRERALRSVAIQPGTVAAQQFVYPDRYQHTVDR